MNSLHNTPKLTVHRAGSRGAGEHGWLSTRFSFSFADWYDPRRMGFGALRVLNDDSIREGTGFGLHSHRDMEIVSIVTSGVLSHKDSMGSSGSLRAGDVQVMSAGTGVRHSEYNGGEGTLDLFQIWIMPNRAGHAPRYDERSFGVPGLGETALVGPMGMEGVLHINQDAYVSRLSVDKDHPIDYQLKKKGNGVYFFVIEGGAVIAGEKLEYRDAIGVEGVDMVNVSSFEKSDILAIEVPMM